MSQSECREVLEANQKQWVSSYFVQMELVKAGTRISINTIRENLRKLESRWDDIEVRLNPERSCTAKEYRYIKR